MTPVIFPDTYKHNRSVDEVTASQITMVNPKTVVDVGCGDGFYGNVVRQLIPDANIIGVELSPRWFDYCRHSSDYDEVVLSSAACYAFPICDLVIFGDVLEHMDKSTAMECLSLSLSKARFVLVNGPVGFQPQPHADSEEIHRCGITRLDFDEGRILEYTETEPGAMMNCLMRGRQ